MGEYFKGLNYSLGDEDTGLEYSLLQYNLNHVVSVAGSGARLIPLLAKRPMRLSCVDISPLQLAFTQMRIELLRSVNRLTFLSFLGYNNEITPKERFCIFEKLNIGTKERHLLSFLFEKNKWQAPIYLGKFERTLRTLSWINRVIVGQSAQDIFLQSSLADQREYFNNHFPILRWKGLVALLGNSTVLNSLLYKGSFPKKNIDKSAFTIYEQIFDHLFTEIPVRKSFLLQMIFFGKLIYEDGFLLECNREIYSAAQEAVRSCHVDFICRNIFDFMSEQDDVGFVSLSDVPSFLPDSLTNSVLQNLRLSLSPGAIIVIRGHMKVVRPDSHGFINITDKYANLLHQETTQLWHIDIYQYAKYVGKKI